MMDRARPRCLHGQRIAPRPRPRGAGLPRRWPAGAAYAALAICATVVYGLATYGALALWRAW